MISGYLWPLSRNWLWKRLRGKELEALQPFDDLLARQAASHNARANREPKFLGQVTELEVFVTAG